MPLFHAGWIARAIDDWRKPHPRKGIQAATYAQTATCMRLGIYSDPTVATYPESRRERTPHWAIVAVHGCPAAGPSMKESRDAHDKFDGGRLTLLEH